MVKFSGVVTLVLGTGFFFAGIVKVLHIQESGLQRIAGLFGVLIAAIVMLGLGIYMWAQENSHEQFFAWDQIAAVEYKRVINTQYGSVMGKDDSIVQFSSYTFFRPPKLVNLIAARLGQPVREMAS